jgi:DNA-binding YbaB/EbfC family protein
MANLNKLLKQAQKMQEQIQREMETLEIEESVGGGMVTIRMNGQKSVLGVTVDPALLAPSEKEMLEDLFAAAVNEAARKVDEALQSKMGGMGGGLGFPGV